VEELLRRLVVDPASTYLLADTFFVSPVTLARKLGVPCVSFWTQPALSFALYHHMDLLAKHGHFRCEGNHLLMPWRCKSSVTFLQIVLTNLSN
jgi:hypothetical protein